VSDASNGRVCFVLNGATTKLGAHDRRVREVAGGIGRGGGGWWGGGRGGPRRLGIDGWRWVWVMVWWWSWESVAAGVCVPHGFFCVTNIFAHAVEHPSKVQVVGGRPCRVCSACAAVGMITEYQRNAALNANSNGDCHKRIYRGRCQRSRDNV